MAINDPRDIPGLVVWYSAEAETGYADGATMTGWTDLSGNGYHATIPAATTPKWRSSGGPNNGPRVDTTTGYFYVPNAAVSSLTAATAEIWIDPPEGTGNGGLWDFGSTNDSAHYPYSGTIYDDFGTTVRKTVGSLATTVAARQWQRYRASTAAGLWRAWIDGTQKFTTATNTVGWKAGPAFLAFTTGYSVPAITAFVLYDHVLTTTEEADLEAWMAAHPSGGTVGAGSVTGTLAAALPPLSANITGTSTPPAATGTLAASLPPLSADLTGTAAPPGVSGTLNAALPPLSASLTGDNAGIPGVSGTLAAALPALSASLTGQSFGVGTEGYLEASLPALSASITGTAANRAGFGLILDSTAVLTVADVLEPEPSVPAGTPSTVLHIIAPTVPAPTLVAGRPQ